MKKYLKLIIAILLFWIPFTICLLFSWKYALVFIVGSFCCGLVLFANLVRFYYSHIPEIMKTVLFINKTFDIPELRKVLEEKHPGIKLDEFEADVDKLLNKE